jgi:hypothetical protein
MSKKHGMKGSPTYLSWRSMKSRCLNENDPYYYRYGGRGITVCERWLAFEAFLHDMGERPESKVLERIDNDKGYYLENCRWATAKEQARNRSNNRLVELNKEKDHVGRVV